MTEPQGRPYREFGAWLRSRRLARRWTQEELATRLNYDVTYVRKIEWGARKATEGFRARLAEVFELPPESLPDSEGGVTRVTRVPAPATSFVGRSEEVEAVTSLLGDGARLVTLVGAPGIGKTRLAIEVAARLDESFEHGACFVPLVTLTDPAGLAAAVGQALGLRSGPRSVEDLLASQLAQHELLLVLDNFEHLIAGAPFVSRLLAGAAALRVLVTSREALRVSGETEYVVAPLPAGIPESPAVQLFLERVRLVQPGFTGSAEDLKRVSQICVTLDGVPLAIELAAAAGRLLSPRELLDDIDRILDLPVAGPRDAPEHQQTLRATIDWSYRLLEEGERALFARLGVFVGGFTLEAAAAVCGDDDTDRAGVIGGVAALVRKSLFETRHDHPSGSRVVALEAIREYALERLRERNELAELRSRHATYYVELAEAAEPHLTSKDQVRWLDVLGDDRANLVAALDWTVRRSPRQAARLAAALFRFWLLRGHAAEGRQWFEQVLALDLPEDQSRVRAQIGAGVLARSQGDYEGAARLFSEASELAQQLAIDEELALARLNSAIVEENRARYDAAAELFEQSLALYQRVGNPRGVAHALNGLATVALGRDDHDSAGALLEQAFAAFRSLEDPWSTALVCTNLGWVAYAAGDTGSARTWYGRSLSLHRTVGHDRGVANALCNLGRAALMEGHLSEATAFLEEALLLFQRLGERRGMAECLEELAATAVARREFDRAVRLYAAAAGLREIIGTPLWPAELEQQTATLADLRTEMGEASYGRSWADGRGMSVDDAVALALARTPSLSEHDHA